MSVMGFNAGLALQAALVTEKAAIAASNLAGQGDEKAAAALRCVGGQMQGRLQFRNDDEIARARRLGIDQLDTKYDLDGLAAGPTIFSATGVTQGSLLDGVKIRGDRVHTHTLIMNSVDGSVQRLRSDRPVKG